MVAREILWPADIGERECLFLSIDARAVTMLVRFWKRRGAQKLTPVRSAARRRPKKCFRLLPRSPAAHRRAVRVVRRGHARFRDRCRQTLARRSSRDCPGGKVLVGDLPRGSLGQELWDEDYCRPDETKKVLTKASDKGRP